jgi:hypothetical protein
MLLLTVRSDILSDFVKICLHPLNPFIQWPAKVECERKGGWDWSTREQTQRELRFSSTTSQTIEEESTYAKGKCSAARQLPPDSGQSRHTPASTEGIKKERRPPYKRAICRGVEAWCVYSALPNLRHFSLHGHRLAPVGASRSPRN